MKIVRKYRKIFCTFLSVLMTAVMIVNVSASEKLTHTVQKGDSLWRIACLYEIGCDEIIAANTQIKDPDLIYPGDVVYIPQLSDEVREVELEIIRLVNEIRAENGLSPLTEDWELSRVARYKSADMSDNGYFSHTSPTYGSPFDMMKSFGLSYRTAGENIARGYKTAKAVVDGWMGSSGHRANILNASFDYIGVGYDPDGNYYTQMFIGR